MLLYDNVLDFYYALIVILLIEHRIYDMHTWVELWVWKFQAINHQNNVLATWERQGNN